MNKELNKDNTNISYYKLDIYKESWSILPSTDVDVVMIDADHSYESCKSDLLNALQQFKNLKYIIFDDYGAFVGVKQVVDEFIEKKTLQFETFAGMTDNLPCVQDWVDKSITMKDGKIMNINEGIIVKVLC